MAPLFDPGLLSFTATVGKNATPKKVLDRMRAEVAKAKRSGITPSELKRARTRLLSQIADERDGIYNEMRSVSESLAAGDWTLGYRFEEQLRKLKSAEVNAVIKKYLVPEGETSGTLIDTAI